MAESPATSAAAVDHTTTLPRSTRSTQKSDPYLRRQEGTKETPQPETGNERKSDCGITDGTRVDKPTLPYTQHSRLPPKKGRWTDTGQATAPAAEVSRADLRREIRLYVHFRSASGGLSSCVYLVLAKRLVERFTVVCVCVCGTTLCKSRGGGWLLAIGATSAAFRRSKLQCTLQ